VTVCCHLLLFEAARDLHQGMNLIYVGVDLRLSVVERRDL